MSTKMPGLPQRGRVIAYIDGYNLYHGIREKEWQRFLWLDLSKLSSSLIRETQDVVMTKYFTTRISSPESKRKRQSNYLEALQLHCQGSVDMFWGHYQIEPWKCNSCGQTEPVPHEKKTDVNIAVEMMVDAFSNKFDTALLISADSDLVPPIVSIRKLYPEKRIVVAFPPARFSAELQGKAHVSFEIGRAKFAAAQLPETITKKDGAKLTRPVKWTDTPKTNFGAALKSALES